MSWRVVYDTDGAGDYWSYRVGGDSGKGTSAANFTLAPAPTKTGYNFSGWRAYAVDGNFFNITFASNYINYYNDKNTAELYNYTFNTGYYNQFSLWSAGTTLQANYTYYLMKAEWSAITFYIVYRWHNGGEEYQYNKTFGQTYTLLGEKTAPTGYTHTGWTNDMMGNKGLSASVVFNFYAGDVAITATYTANTYTVTYNGNGADGGSTAQNTATYDSRFTLQTNGFTRTGYDFTAWYLYTNGGTYLGAYGTVGGTYAYGIWNIAQNCYANAQWRIKNYDAIFNANGKGTGKTVNQNYNSSVALPTLKAIGYTFMGWATSSTATTPDVTQSFNMPVNGRTLYAVWKDNTTTAPSGKPTTGIFFSDFQTVYGGTDPISINEYQDYVGKSVNTPISVGTDLRGKGPAP